MKEALATLTLALVAAAACGPSSTTAPPRTPTEPPGGTSAIDDIDRCEQDTDCTLIWTCDCNGCVAHRDDIEYDACPSVCDTDACGGHTAVCRDGACTVE